MSEAAAYLEGRYDIAGEVRKLCNEYDGNPTKSRDILIVKLRELTDRYAPVGKNA